jgi:predicted phosphoribosyltransferase
MKRFKDREEAGKLLAEKIKELNLNPEETVILAIPRGGVPVAYQISKETNIPFSLVIVKKLTFPDDPELAVGAIAPDETYVVDPMYFGKVSQGNVLEQMKQKALKEIKERINKYLNGKVPDIKNKNVIVVDDGLATGYTALVAGLYARNLGAKKLILAVPVAPSDSVSRAYKVYEKVVVYERVNTPFFAVGAYYEDFHQLTDAELFYYLEKAKNENLLYQEEESEKGDS